MGSDIQDAIFKHVIPAQAGIQFSVASDVQTSKLDSRLRGNDR